MVKIKIFSSKFVPEYKTIGSAGMDLNALTFEDIDGCIFDDDYKEKVTIPPFGRVMIHTGVKVIIPHGYSGSLRLRSSLGKKGCVIPNAPGTIDSDYRGEICIVLVNLNKEDCVLRCGERVAQLVIEYTPQAELEIIGFSEFNKAGNSSIRGGGGFGSTGK